MAKQVQALALDMGESSQRQRWWRPANVARAARRNRIAAVCVVIIVVISGMAIAAPLVATHDPIAIQTREAYTSPGSAHWLGTDQYGRDVFSRIVYGARTSLMIGLATVVVASGAGFVLGVIAGTAGGWVDRIMLSIADAIIAVPTLFVAMSLVAALGFSGKNVVAALSVALFPGMFRISRSVTYSTKEEQFVEAARSVGASWWRVLGVHILPQCAPAAMVMASAALAGAILAESSLSFLGFGVPPPNPSWGSMLAGRVIQDWERAPWLLIFPGMALSVTVLAVNLLGDAISDALDPRRRLR